MEVGHSLCPWLCGSDVFLSSWHVPPWTGQGRAEFPSQLRTLQLVLTEATKSVFHFVTQGLGGLCFFQGTEASGKVATPVREAGKEETRNSAQKQKPSPVSPAASKEPDQVEA